MPGTRLPRCRLFQRSRRRPRNQRADCGHAGCMAGQDSFVKQLAPLLLLLLAGCAVGRYADLPEFKLPETRTVAARQLNEVLTGSAIGLSEVVADEVRLTWHERHQLT